MTQTQTDFKATLETVRTLHRQGILPKDAFKRALQLIGHTPQRGDWVKFVNVLLLGLGSLLLISGIFFFLAYNWTDLSRFARFGTVEVALIVSAGLATWAGLERIAGKTALTFSALLIGALLLVFGQEYQTGADSYELFWNWALLMTGLALIARFDLLWGIWLGLLNLTIYFYWDQVQPGLDWPGWEVLFLLNAGALLIWELLSRWRGLVWMRSHWLPRVVTLVAFGWILIPTVALIFAYWNTASGFIASHQAAVLLYAIFLLSVVGVYQWIYPDLFMLTVAALSLIIVLTAWSGRWLVEADGVFGTLATGVLVIVQAGLAGYWLRSLQKRMEATA